MNGSFFSFGDFRRGLLRELPTYILVSIPSLYTLIPFIKDSAVIFFFDIILYFHA